MEDLTKTVMPWVEAEILLEDGTVCEHRMSRVDATVVKIESDDELDGQRHLKLRIRCEVCRHRFRMVGPLTFSMTDGNLEASIRLAIGPKDTTPQCECCKKDMPGQEPGVCPACKAEARAKRPVLIGCNGSGLVTMGPGVKGVQRCPGCPRCKKGE